jgi:hypothetical protein
MSRTESSERRNVDLRWEDRRKSRTDDANPAPSSALTGRVDYVDLAERVIQGIIVNRIESEPDRDSKAY